MFNTILFSFHVFECFWAFTLKLVSSFKPLWSEKVFDMTSNFLNSLRLVLCHTMWSIFENVPCEFEKNIHFVSFRGNVLYVYQLSPFDLECCSVPQYPCSFFAWKIYPLLTMGCYNPLLWVCCCWFLSRSSLRFSLYIWVILYWMHICL